MGPLIKYTKRLLLRVEDSTRAQDVLDLYLRNRYAFELYEPTRPDDFYSLAYHETAMHREYLAYTLGQFLRYYIYLKDYPDKIVGAINFNFYQGTDGPYVELGYKVDTAYQNVGIAYEACEAGFDVIREHYDIHRVDARIHPDNAASLSLAHKLGFAPVCYEPQSANIMGHYVDLVRHSRII